MMRFGDGRNRVIIEGVKPEIDGGRFPIKRTLGEKVVVEADIFTDSHDALSCILLHRKDGESRWQERSMEFLVNDRWRGEFAVTELGQYRYTVQAWVDHFKSWRQGLLKKFDAGYDISVDLSSGADLVEEAIKRAARSDAKKLKELALSLRSDEEGSDRVHVATAEELSELMAKYPDKELATMYDQELVVVVDRPKARFSAWYQMFPRSCASEPGRHGTFKDCEARLPYIAGMGFDVLYFPPIHPIGQTHRKGKNNNPAPRRDDPGSPWAIGSAEGGHRDIHPQLGSFEDFRLLVTKASECGLSLIHI